MSAAAAGGPGTSRSPNAAAAAAWVGIPTFESSYFYRQFHSNSSIFGPRNGPTFNSGTSVRLLSLGPTDGTSRGPRDRWWGPCGARGRWESGGASKLLLLLGAVGTPAVALALASREHVHALLHVSARHETSLHTFTCSITHMRCQNAWPSRTMLEWSKFAAIF